jgi:hypothetical protein
VQVIFHWCEVAAMDGRQRFLETMHHGTPDHVPYVDQVIRQDTLDRWYREGLPRGRTVAEVFDLDCWQVFGARDEIQLDLYPHPDFTGRLRTLTDVERWKRSHNPTRPHRYPRDWPRHVRRWAERDHALGIRVCRGFLLSLMVGDWESLTDALYMTCDAPDLLAHMTVFLADFLVEVLTPALGAVQFDYALFDEPIASNSAPVVGPDVFRRFMQPLYRRVCDLLDAHGVGVRIFSSHGHVQELVPAVLEAGINTLWIGNTGPAGLDYVAVRREYGRDLQLIGGIDVRVLEADRAAIEAEVMRVVPPLLEQGGYVPMVDGRVRKYVPYGNYRAYRELIRDLAQRG